MPVRRFLRLGRRRKRERNRVVKGQRGGGKKEKVSRPPGSLVILLSTLLHVAICVLLCIVARRIYPIAYEADVPPTLFLI